MTAALASKDAVFNILGYGSEIPGPFAFDFSPMFDLTPYGGNADVRILGVESDVADGVADGQHNYVGFNTASGAPSSNAGATAADALQVSYNGSNTGPTGMVATGKSILFSTTGSGEIGPSSAGYRAMSVPFQDADVAGTGSVVLSNLYIPVSIPFTFTYYGTSYTQIWVNDDGTIRFGNGGVAPGDPGFVNADLSREPSSLEIPLAAALWDDISGSPDHGSQVRTRWRTSMATVAMIWVSSGRIIFTR